MNTIISRFYMASGSLLGGAGGLAIVIFVNNPSWKILLLAVSAIPVIFMFAPLVVLSIIKSEDGAMATVLMVVYSMALHLPQVMLVVGRGK
jgi:uncharacterized membrane protein YhaH (DUF805 family)